MMHNLEVLSSSTDRNMFSDLTSDLQPLFWSTVPTKLHLGLNIHPLGRATGLAVQLHMC